MMLQAEIAGRPALTPDEYPAKGSIIRDSQLPSLSGEPVLGQSGGLKLRQTRKLGADIDTQGSERIEELRPTVTSSAAALGPQFMNSNAGG
jgi:hypothetical protein